MAKVTADDRKYASQFMTLITRNAYGGNMLSAEHSLAKLLADERERNARKLDNDYPEAAALLRNSHEFENQHEIDFVSE